MVLVAAMGISFASQAQFNSRLGRFQADKVSGCAGAAGLTVNITSNDCTSSCDMFFYGPDSTSLNDTFSHTYTTPGKYLLTIVFGSDNNPDDIEIEVFPDTPPQFELYTCNGNGVSVNITDTSFESYVVNFNDGTPEVTWSPGDPAPQHVYGGVAGNQTVSVRGRNAGSFDNCSANTQTITTMAALPIPLIPQLQVIDNSAVQLTYNTQPNILYRLEVATNGSTSFQFLKNVYNVSIDTVENLRTEDNFYCFRLVPISPCDNTLMMPSPVICSINFDLAVQNNANNVTWTTNTIGVINLRLVKTTQNNSFTTTVTTSPFSDTDIDCGTEYCYQLIANYPNNSQSISLLKCGTAISTDIPAPIENITLAVQPNGLDIQWQPVTGFTQAEASVFKSDGNLYDLLLTTADVQVTDESYTIENPGCYKISYSDVCGNTSELSAEACPIVLRGNLLKDNTINLAWTAYSGWRNGVSQYVVQKYAAEGGQLLQTFNAAANLTFIDETEDLTHQSYIYVVSAVPTEGGLPQAVSNTLFIIKDPDLFHPTAFTPNGDNLNDIFNVYGHYITVFEMNIFNRWGELMYTTTDLDEGWDGYFKGNPMPEGTYTFVADITDSAGRTFKKSGSVLLLRKK